MVNIFVSFVGDLARNLLSQAIRQKRDVLGQLIHDAFGFDRAFVCSSILESSFAV